MVLKPLVCFCFSVSVHAVTRPITARDGDQSPRRAGANRQALHHKPHSAWSRMSFADLQGLKRIYVLQRSAATQARWNRPQGRFGGLAQYLTFAVPFCGCEGAIRVPWRKQDPI